MQSLERLTCGTKRLKCTKAMSYVTLFFSFFYIVSRQKICYVCKFKFFNVCHLWQFLWNIFRLNIRSPLPTDCWLENLFLSVTNFLSFQQFPDESISGVHLYLNRETRVHSLCLQALRNSIGTMAILGTTQLHCCVVPSIFVLLICGAQLTSECWN